MEGQRRVSSRPTLSMPVHLLVNEAVLGLHGVMDLTHPPGRVVDRY